MKKTVRSPATPVLVLLVAFAGSIGSSSAALAQTGSIRGRVVDQEGNPVKDVEVVVEFLGGVTRTRKVKTNDHGEYVIVGLPTGDYRATYVKESYQPIYQEIKVPGGATLRVDDAVLPKSEAAGPDPETTKLFNEGVAAAKKGDFQAALTAFEQYAEKVPDSAEAHFNAGFASEQLNDLNGAVSHYQKAVELRPDYYEAYLALGDLYGIKRDWTQAGENLEKALELKPDEILPLYNFGVVQLNLQNMAAAQDAFEKVIALDPLRADAHFQLGIVLVNQGKTEEAIPHLEKYLELEPEGKNAATARGLVEQLKTQ